ncbi:MULTISPECIES: E2/UBC family protein [unclassified Mesorhizobium]|uniref:E2/UBC family protein n=1 Tax=unclassified Mesorhizobium TaxID=325217 RepID=UPI00333BD23F
MISPITLKEIERVQERFPEATYQELPSTAVLVTLPKVALPEGWSLNETPLWFLVPVGYPGPCPDCFWAHETLRLAGGALPQATQLQGIPETPTQALWFSWHVTDIQTQWNPARDKLSTYVSIILDRLRKVQ